MNAQWRLNASRNTRSRSPIALSSALALLHVVFTLAILIVALLCWTSAGGASAQLDSRLGSLPAFREFDAPPLLYQSNNDGDGSPFEEATTVKRMRKRPFRIPAPLFFGYRPATMSEADDDTEELRDDDSGGGAPSKRAKHQQTTLRDLFNEMNAASGGSTQRRMRSRLLCMMALASPVACRDI